MTQFFLIWHTQDTTKTNPAKVWRRLDCRAGARSGLTRYRCRRAQRKSQSAVSIPVTSLSPAEIFAEALAGCGLTGATSLRRRSAIVRCEAVGTALRWQPLGIPYLRKHRTGTGITHAGLIGKVARQVVIVDDIQTPEARCCRLARSSWKPELRHQHHGYAWAVHRGPMEEAVATWGEADSLQRHRAVPADVDASSIVMLSVVPLIESKLRALAET